jgi:hypothetical protein
MLLMRTAILAITVLILTSCQKSSVYRVGERSFRIPSSYLETVPIAWLPPSQKDAPLLVLNPDADGRDRVSALLEPASVACQGIDASSKGTWVHECLPGAMSAPALVRFKIDDLRKVPDKYGVTWQYFTTAPASRPRLIATCSRMTNQRWGLCRHLFRNADILVSVGLGEDQLTALPAIRRNLDRALKDWEL